MDTVTLSGYLALMSPPNLKVMGERARAVAEGLSLAAMSEKLFQLYCELLGSAPLADQQN